MAKRIGLAIALLLGACASPAIDTPGPPANPVQGSPGPISSQEGLEVADLAIVDQHTGEEVRFVVELADDAESRSVGLMFVPELRAGTGMAFLYDEPHGGSFYMKNTLIPLDIAFWDGSMTIVSLQRMEPCDPDVPRCPLYDPGQDYIGAVEVNAGALEDAGVQVGDSVELSG